MHSISCNLQCRVSSRQPDCNNRNDTHLCLSVWCLPKQCVVDIGTGICLFYHCFLRLSIQLAWHLTLEHDFPSIKLVISSRLVTNHYFYSAGRLLHPRFHCIDHCYVIT